ncbi:MAG TPA: chemotaxis protein CheW [Lysobacter sp.]
MNTLTVIDDYLDALLDGTLPDGIAFDENRGDGIGREGRPHASASPAPGLVDTAVMAEVETDVGVAGAVVGETTPPSAADRMPEPAIHRDPEPAPLVSRGPTPAFVPAFVPSALTAIAAAPATTTGTALAAQDTPVSAMATSHRWLRVTIGNDSYALELLRVQEVVRLAPIVALRGAARAVLGVMNLRGRIVPVVDLGLWLDAGCVHGDERSRIVVVERDDEMIGVLVSAVEDVVTLGRERIEPPLASSDPGAIVGIARVGASPTVLLEATALFG